MSIHAKKFRIEKTFCVAGIKQTKKILRTKSFWNVGDLSFLHRSQKMSFHPDFFCTNIECSYVHPKFLFDFFYILKFVF